MNPLEQYLPYIRILLIALVPALIIYFIEQRNITSLRTQLAAVQATPAEPPLTLIFTAKDVTTVNNLATAANQLTSTIDQYRPNNSISELVCMQALRNGASSYLSDMVGQLRRQMAASLSMKHEQDVKYSDQQVLYTIQATLKYVPTIRNTLNQMGPACTDSPSARDAQDQINNFLNGQLVPAFNAMQATLSKAKY